MSDPLLELLRENPNCRVTISSGRHRKRYREGDTKIVKGRRYVKTARLAYHPNGKVAGYDCTGGRQRYDWIRVPDTHPHSTNDKATTNLKAP